MAYLLNRTDIYTDEDNTLECPNCYNGNLYMSSAEIEKNKNNNEIKNITIEFKCVNCDEDVKKLKLSNNTNTSVTINWLLHKCEYAKMVAKLFNK